MVQKENQTQREFFQAFAEFLKNEHGWKTHEDLQAEIKQIKKEEKANEPSYLTRGQVAKILQISLPTLHDYTKRGLINSYRIGVKVRYKQIDIETALKQRNFGKKGGSYGA